MKSGLRIGRVSLEKHAPTVIAPFTDRTPPATLRTAAARGLDLAEARVDLFDDRTSAHVIGVVRGVAEVVPVLATLRSSKEGGRFGDDEDGRAVLYRELLPHVGAIDIELDARVRASVVQAARRRKVPVVLSHHDFDGTPTDAVLDGVVARSREAGADITKIAALVKTERDGARLAALFARHPNVPLVVIGMGELGKKTRILFPALGSLFTFASLDRSTAPGQMSLAETIRELCRYFPGYATRFSERRVARAKLPRKR
ncbi:MAG TPA: type I 3-dehydroquinate dehydratase [Polyangiaceae bacterium]